MSPVIVDLTAQRGGAAVLEPLQHPAGVRLPFEGPSDAALIIPEIRSEVREGTYSADMIGLLPEAIEPGDRVLVIGAGLGVVSTLVGKAEGVERVIAVEANTTLIPYLRRVHELNGVPEVEIVNAVLAEDKQGRVPFFARRDLRLSSLLPHDRSWQQVMMVPFMNLNLILAEERISLVVCDIPVTAATLVAHAALETVDRVLINCSDEPAACWEEEGACAQMIQRGFLPEPAGGGVLFRRAAGVLAKAATAADVEAEPVAETGIEADEFEDEDFGDDETDGVGHDIDDAEADGDTDEAKREHAQDAGDLLGADFTPFLDAGPPPRDQVPDIETEWEVEPHADKTAVAAGEHFASLFEDLPGERSAARRGAAQTGPSVAPAPDDAPAGAPAETHPAEEPGAEAAVAEAPVAEAPVAETPVAETPGAETFAAEKPSAEAPAAHPPAGEAKADEPPADDRPAEDHPTDGVAAAAPASTVATAEQGGTGTGDSSRLWAIAGLALAMALPLMAIGEFAGSRAERHAAAAAQSMAAWGGPQTMTGPFLMVPVETAAGLPTPPIFMLPDRLQVASTLETSLRREGAFPIPAYRGRHQVSLDFDPDFLTGERVAALLAAGESLRWDQAVLGVGITQPKALTGAPVLARGAGQARFEAGTGAAGLPGIQARTGDPRDDARGWSFTLELDGAAAFNLTPAGRITEARIEAAWDAPGIGAAPAGAFRPGSEQAGQGGVAAHWSVPQLAHSLPSAFRGTGALNALDAVAFGIGLEAAGSLYQGAQRAAKFGFLLIVLSFVVLLGIERAAGRRPNLLQYAMIGIAQCLFYLLMVPLAEVVGLGAGFAATTVATVALLTAYAWAGMGLGPRSLWLAAALGALYAAMYLLLTGTGHMLLTGAVLAFALLAAAMWLTRVGVGADPAKG